MVISVGKLAMHASSSLPGQGLTLVNDRNASYLTPPGQEVPKEQGAWGTLHLITGV